MEEYLIHGPGDIRGEPARLDEETRALIYRMYEVFPKGHKQAGRRRFKRVGISLRKGTAKTEKAAWITACELHPDAPVRCVGWDKDQPIGGGVTDPYIPMVAYTEEQSDELAYNALLVIISEGPLASDFDIGLQRIMRKDGAGKAVSLATAPDSRDGARTTFQVFDETHRFTLPRLKEAHRTMMANIPKRRLADAWSLETTTASAPGEGSVAEATMDYARAVAEGKLKDSRLFFFHRQASDGYDLTTEKGVREAVVDASGPAAEWSDIEGIVEQWRDPTSDRNYLERVWLNRPVTLSSRAFNGAKWKELARPDYVVPKGAPIVLGFDGSRREDSTALVGTEIMTGFQWLIGLWEKPLGLAGADWSVPGAEVDAAVEVSFERWKVWRMYADPWGWGSELSNWASRWGTGKDGKIWEWRTNRWAQTAGIVQNYAVAIETGEVTHDGNEEFARHIGNAYRRTLSLRDSDGVPLWVVQKERPDSPMKMDAAMAALLAWEARQDAVAEGMAKPPAAVLPIGEAGGKEDRAGPEFAGVRKVTI
jgi:phage terminase large subunit-like protein